MSTSAAELEPHQIIDMGGADFNLAVLEMMLKILSQGQPVLIRNCRGGNILDLGLSLMAWYDRYRSRP